MPNIRNLDAYRDAAFDWSCLNECFRPTNIRVTDIDGCVERNGDFLYLEAKPMARDIPTGQRIMFDALVQQGSTVMVIWHDEAKRVVAVSYWPNPRQLAGVEDLKVAVRDWFDRANARLVGQRSRRHPGTKAGTDNGWRV